MSQFPKLLYSRNSPEANVILHHVAYEFGYVEAHYRHVSWFRRSMSRTHYRERVNALIRCLIRDGKLDAFMAAYTTKLLTR